MSFGQTILASAIGGLVVGVLALAGVVIAANLRAKADAAAEQRRVAAEYAR